MIGFGQGHCNADYLRGWDGKGTASQDACNQVCENEEDCTFAAFLKDTSCSRFKGTECVLEVGTQNARSYFTFKKHTGKPGGIILI